MTESSTEFVFNDPGMFEVFQDQEGPVGRSLYARGTAVQLAARRQVGKDTHKLERSIIKRWGRGPVGRGAAGRGDLVMSIGSDVWYALMHHDGTRAHIITPRNPNGCLRFVVDGRVVFAKLVHHPGTRPNHYLSDNLPLAVE